MATFTAPTELMEDAHKRDTRGRRIAEPERRAEILAGYVGSGLSQKAYARREGINYHTFVAWLGRSRHNARSTSGTQPAVAAEPRFAQLTWPPPLAATSSQLRLEVVLPDGITLRGDDPAALVILVRALAPRRPC